jgi:hypothetical protein
LLAPPREAGHPLIVRDGLYVLAPLVPGGLPYLTLVTQGENFLQVSSSSRARAS